MVEDVGAEVGMIVTNSGTTAAAQRRARAERGVRLGVLPLEELVQWSPPRTIAITHGVPTPRFSDAERVLRGAGFRVRPELAYEARSGERLLCAFRHTGQRNPGGEIQHELLQLAEDALQGEDIEVQHVAHGLTIAGGTPGHRWLGVLAAGVHTGIKVLASSESELDQQLDDLARPLLTLASTAPCSQSRDRPAGPRRRYS